MCDKTKFKKCDETWSWPLPCHKLYHLLITNYLTFLDPFSSEEWVLYGLPLPDDDDVVVDDDDDDDDDSDLRRDSVCDFSGPSIEIEKKKFHSQQ